MIDVYRRNIDYLRVSITDRCNLHCRYCLPPGLETAEKDRERYLTKEEILRVCRAAETIGIHKFKITGGEPLVRTGENSGAECWKRSKRALLWGFP